MDNYSDDQKGLYILPEDSNYVLYYYGKVDNNYIKYDDKLWRIVRTNKDKTIKIILDDNIPVMVEKANISYDGKAQLSGTGEFIDITNKTLSCKYIDLPYPETHKRVCFLNYNFIPIEQYKSFYCDSFKCNYYDNDRILSEDAIPFIDTDFKNFDIADSLYNPNTFYYRQIQNWYNNAINDKSNIINYQFCDNKYADSPYSDRDFTCKGKLSYNTEEYKKYVGFISYKELKLSGGENSYLTVMGDNQNKSFFTADFTGYGEYAFYYNADTNSIDSVDVVTTTSGDKFLYHYKSAGLETPQIQRIGITEGIYSYGYIYLMGLRPVVNLKSDLCYKGEGTKDNPYTIKEGNC